MKIYYMPEDKYGQIWDDLEEKKDRIIYHEVVDRWLSIYHGLCALDDRPNENDCYPFSVRDETKVAWFILKYY